MVEEEEDKPEGESLAQYISRLEALTGSERVRVPKQFIDKHGNVILPPSAIYLVDNEGTLHESATTAGNFTSTPYGIAAGGIHRASGTYTKNATGTVGGVFVTPAADDILYFMYGYVLIGAAKAGAGILTCGINADVGLGAPTAEWVQVHLRDGAVNADEIFYFPVIGTAGTAPLAVSGPPILLTCMIPGANYITDIGATTLIASQPAYHVDLTVMANTEVFYFALHFFSLNNTAPTLTAYEGAIS